MVLLASAYDQSRFFRAEDITQETTLRIKNMTEELVSHGAVSRRNWWCGSPTPTKGLPLNRTNNRTIRGAYGDDTAGWVNKLIVMFPTQADFRGRLVAALRVRIPPPKQASGNGQATKTALDQFAETSPTRPDSRPRNRSTTTSTMKFRFEGSSSVAAGVRLRPRHPPPAFQEAPNGRPRLRR